MTDGQGKVREFYLGKSVGTLISSEVYGPIGFTFYVRQKGVILTFPFSCHLDELSKISLARNDNQLVRAVKIKHLL